MSPDDRRRFAEKCRQSPPWFAQFVLGVQLWHLQKEILFSIRDNVRTAVKACHAPGKTFTAAVAVLWFLAAHKDAIVITTAPTWRQVKDVLWREIRRLRERSIVDLGGDLKLDPPTLEFGAKWYAMGLSPKDEDSFAGWHAPYVLVICDEASGVPVKILEALRGLMASGHVRLLYLGNPLRPEGGFYDAFNKAKALWKCFTIGAFQTPNLHHLAADFFGAEFKEDKLRILRTAETVNPHLITASWVADCLEEFGEDSDFWISRVLGEFPDGAPNQLIPLWQANEAAIRWQALVDRDPKDPNKPLPWWLRLHQWKHEVRGGFDVARQGDNESVFAAGSQDVYAPLLTRDKLDTDGVVDFGRLGYRQYNCDRANVDNVGFGGGPSDLLEKTSGMNFVGLNVGEPAVRSDLFINLRAETFFKLRKKFEEGAIAVPPDDKLLGQLSSIRYDATGRRIKIESKEDMKNRGVKSPDRADAVMLAEAESVKSPPPDGGYQAPETDVYTVERRPRWA